MRTLLTFGAVLAVAVATPAIAAQDSLAASAAAGQATGIQAQKGESVYDAQGKRIGKIYQVSRTGDPQIIVDLRLITVPSATLSRTDGKLVSSLSRRDLTK